jgi:hypothetical protein
VTLDTTTTATCRYLEDVVHGPSHPVMAREFGALRASLAKVSRYIAGYRPSPNDLTIRIPDVLSSTQYDNIADHQGIHLGAQKAVERLLGSANHRLVLVERRVKHHWHAGHAPEVFD